MGNPVAHRLINSPYPLTEDALMNRLMLDEEDRQALVKAIAKGIASGEIVECGETADGKMLYWDSKRYERGVMDEDED